MSTVDEKCALKEIRLKRKSDEKTGDGKCL